MRWLFPLALAAALASCSVNVEGAACPTPGSPDGCPGGQRCGAAGICSAAAMGCEVCTPDALACRDGAVKRCTAAADPVCGGWVVEEDCPAAGLACPDGAAAACACPAHLESPVVLHADPGAATRAGLVRNGALTSACRYLSLADALAAASAGDVVKAVGFAGTPVVFTEPPLTVPAGVAITTADEPPAPGNYVVEPAASVGAAAFVTLRAGASLAGLELRNTDATGVGVQTDCPGAADVAAVTVDAVRISALGAGGTARFSNGLRYAGRCSLALTGSTVEGADDTGVLVTEAAAASLTMAGNTIRLNQANVTPYTIGPSDRRGGGVVFYGAHPDTVVFRGNRVLGNQGDQILVVSPGTLDLSSPACDADANVISCYAAPAVGLSSKFGTVLVAHAAWLNDMPAAGTDFLVQAGATISGATTQACAKATLACP